MNIKKLGESVFLRNVVKLVSATGIAQVIQLLATPVLTRIYSPDEFASYQLFYSIASVISVVATFRYELAIVIPKDEIDAKSIVSGSLLINTGLSVLTLLLLSIVDFAKESDLPNYFYLLPLYVFSAGIFQSFNYWSIRKGTYNLNFGGRIGSSFVQGVGGIILGKSGITSIGLIVAVVAGQITAAVILAKDFLLAPLQFVNGVNRAGISKQFSEQRKFPQFNAPHALIDTLQDHGIIFMMSVYFENSLIAFYGQAFRLLKAPVGFIGAALHQVFYPDFARRYQEGENLRPTVAAFYKRLTMIGGPFFLLLAFVAIPLFKWYLGSKWEQVGIIVQILLPWLFLNFVASPLSSLPLVASRQGTAMMLSTIEIVCRITAIAIGGWMSSSTVAISLISIFGSIFTIINLIWYYRLSKPQ